MTARAQYFLGQEQTNTDAAAFCSHQSYTFLGIKFHRVRILPSDMEDIHRPVLPSFSTSLPLFASTGTDVFVLGWTSL